MVRKRCLRHIYIYNTYIYNYIYKDIYKYIHILRVYICQKKPKTYVGPSFWLKSRFGDRCLCSCAF